MYRHRMMRPSHEGGASGGPVAALSAAERRALEHVLTASQPTSASLAGAGYSSFVQARSVIEQLLRKGLLQSRPSVASHEVLTLTPQGIEALRAAGRIP